MNKDYIVTITDGDFDVTVNTDGEYIVNVGEYISGVGFSNLGTGAEVLKDDSAPADIQFRTLVNGDQNIEITQNANDISLNLANTIQGDISFGGEMYASIVTTQQLSASNNVVINGPGVALAVDNSATFGQTVQTQFLTVTDDATFQQDVNVTGNVTAPNMSFTGTITGSDLNDLVTIDAPTSQNITITTDSDHYIHANTGDLYVGPLSGAVKIDENTISSTVNDLTVTGNLVGNVTGQVSDECSRDFKKTLGFLILS